jgi:ABC-type Mn2+/Zn2+ transport system permease subunit
MLVFDFLVLPAVTGLLLARGMAGVFAWAVGAGLVAAVVGFSISIPFDLPTGPAIVAVSGAIVILAWLVRRARES